jgi:ATP-binding cassette subfamily B protein
VTFAYGDGAPAVADASLTVHAGEQLALVGATGAGKSTLAKLLVRAYDPQAGSVSFGGVNLRDASLKELRSRIVFVPQEGHLFSGSLADNVRLARPEASDDEVRAPCARSAHSSGSTLPEGLATDVRSRGVRPRPASAAVCSRAWRRRACGRRARRSDVVTRPADRIGPSSSAPALAGR